MIYSIGSPFKNDQRSSTSWISGVTSLPLSTQMMLVPRSIRKMPTPTLASSR